jgi:hypothetical protein
MGRVIRTENLSTERNRLMKAIAIAARELAGQPDFGDESRDLAAFIVMALETVGEGIEASVLPWEKRGYWLKADRFRMDWDWIPPLAKEMRAALLDDDEIGVARGMGKLMQKLGAVQVPAKHRLGTPWIGAWDKFYDTQNNAHSH